MSRSWNTFGIITLVLFTGFYLYGVLNTEVREHLGTTTNIATTAVGVLVLGYYLIKWLRNKEAAMSLNKYAVLLTKVCLIGIFLICLYIIALFL